MNLDDAQKKKVSEWIEQGIKLSEIQNRLASELGLTMTYMEVRFLIDDLRLKLKEEEPPAAPAQLPADPAKTMDDAPVPAEEELDEPGPGAATAPAGGVSVTVDQITRPGALISGKVTFSDGNSAEWYLDQTGRLGVAPKTQGYRPSHADVMAFQTELQNVLGRMGL